MRMEKCERSFPQSPNDIGFRVNDLLAGIVILLMLSVADTQAADSRHFELRLYKKIRFFIGGCNCGDFAG